MPDYLARLPWSYIKSKLEAETDYKIKPYDNDLDGILDWRSLQYFGVRQEILAEFENPQVLINTSSMLKVYNSCDRIEYAAGNISATSRELTIVGGTSSDTGRSWIYWNLPEAAKGVYFRLQMNSVNAGRMEAHFCDADASTAVNPPDFYSIIMVSGADLYLEKTVGGSGTTLDSKSGVLAYDTYFDFELYFGGDGDGNNRVIVWMDGSKVFDVSDTEAGIPTIQAVRILVDDNSTSEEQSGKVKGLVVVVYE